MNILFVNRMLSTAWGGGENYDFQLAQGLRQRGHNVQFLSGHAAGASAQKRIGDMEVISVETPYLRRYMYLLAGRVRFIPGLFAELDRHLFQKRALPLLRRLTAERAIHVIQILGMPQLAGSLARHGLPVVMRFPGPPAWFLERMLRDFARRPRTAMFSHGDTVRHFRRRWNIGIDEVPPGVLGQLFQPLSDPGERARRRQALGIGPGDFVLVSVGRLIQGKGHDFLLEAMPEMVRRHSGLRLLIVGEGPLRAALERKADRLGVAASVIFAGQQCKEDVARSLSAADVFCLTSEYENYSNAALEAMACGLPVVASRVGGFPLQVQEGVNGFLVEYGDRAALARKTLWLATEAALRQRLSEGARRFVASFDWGVSAERVSSIYERVLAS